MPTSDKRSRFPQPSESETLARGNAWQQCSSELAHGPGRPRASENLAWPAWLGGAQFVIITTWHISTLLDHS